MASVYIEPIAMQGRSSTDYARGLGGHGHGLAQAAEAAEKEDDLAAACALVRGVSQARTSASSATPKTGYARDLAEAAEGGRRPDSGARACAGVSQAHSSLAMR